MADNHPFSHFAETFTMPHQHTSAFSLKPALRPLGASLWLGALLLAAQLPVQAEPATASRIGFVKFERYGAGKKRVNIRPIVAEVPTA